MAEFNIDKMAKSVAEKALDDYVYQGRKIREWIDIIVQVNKQHGRLIDADAIKYLLNCVNVVCVSSDPCGECSQRVVTKEDIDNMPTIIPASKEEA